MKQKTPEWHAMQSLLKLKQGDSYTNKDNPSFKRRKRAQEGGEKRGKGRKDEEELEENEEKNNLSSGRPTFSQQTLQCALSGPWTGCSALIIDPHLFPQKCQSTGLKQCKTDFL